MQAEFFCLSMSPALDATVALPAWPSDGAVFKDVPETVNVGGKGLNVARWLALRGATTSCGGLLGADNAAPFEQELAKYNIADAFLRVPGETRRNEMISTPNGSFKLNRPAFPSLDTAFDPMQALETPAKARQSSILDSRFPIPVAILSGSLPPAIAKDFYAKAVGRFKSLGWTTVLDSSGEAMRLGLKSRPDLIKPNAEECEPLVGFTPKTPQDFRRATDILRASARHVIISDGGAGAWFDGVFVAAPKVEVVDTTAAGDTLLAEYCWRTFGGETPAPDAARWAVAAGSAACTMPGGAPPPLPLVKSLTH